LAAQLGVLGIDPWRFLATRDSLERNVMVAVANEMVKIRQTMDQNLAILIANQVGRLFKR